MIKSRQWLQCRLFPGRDRSSDYANDHDELLCNKKTRAWDYAAMTSASAVGFRAAIIIKALREYRRKVIFGNTASEAIPALHTLDMGGQFLINKSRIESIPDCKGGAQRRIVTPSTSPAHRICFGLETMPRIVR